MKAIVLEQTGGVENLLMQEVQKPIIKTDEVLVAVKAISINPVDYKVRADDNVLTMISGEQRPAIIGWDIAGTVVETGDDVTRFKKGDNVFGMINFPGSGNGYAEFVSAPENHLAKVPDSISFEAAAATTLAALTALQVLRERVKKDDRVLIHAGSGGVGHFAIQIAKSLGAHVITTSSTKNKAFVFSMGADEHIDYRTEAFEEVAKNIDLVFDMFNGDILYKSVQLVNEGGTVVSLPTPEFSKEIVNLANKRNVKVEFVMVQSNGEDMDTLKGLLEEGILKPYISETFSFSDMGKAHTQQESGRTVGKIVVTL